MKKLTGTVISSVASQWAFMAPAKQLEESVSDPRSIPNSTTSRILLSLLCSCIYVRQNLKNINRKETRFLLAFKEEIPNLSCRNVETPYYAILMKGKHSSNIYKSYSIRSLHEKLAPILNLHIFIDIIRVFNKGNEWQQSKSLIHL